MNTAPEPATTRAGPRLVHLAGCTPQPWRNAGGTTRELLTRPAGADWQWRLSVADIGTDGPFSAYPGVARWFAVLEGDGVELRLPDRTVTLRPGDAPLAFDGADAPGCRLLAGPTRDLNLMLRGVHGRLVPAQSSSPWCPGSASAGLYALAGGVLEADGQSWPMGPATLAWFDEAPATMRLIADGRGAVTGWWIAITDDGIAR